MKILALTDDQQGDPAAARRNHPQAAGDGDQANSVERGDELRPLVRNIKLQIPGSLGDDAL
jgi:hypothetical protein